MKIHCETLVINRQTNCYIRSGPLISTIAVGYKHRKSGPRDSNGNIKREMEILVISPVDSCTRYKVTNNIQKIFNKFQVNDEATISFKLPPDNLQIRCEPKQLKTFLHIIKLGMECKDSISLRQDTFSTRSIPRKSQPIKMMVVKKRSEYPTQGFPKLLTCLEIYDIELQKISFDICSLRYLTIVKLNCNRLIKVPPEFGRLSLTELRMDNNFLGMSNNWDWLKGKPLIHSLRELDLSNNHLKFFPLQLIKYEKMETLKLNMNDIQRLPFGLRRMRALRVLHVCANKLVSLPSVFDEMHLTNLEIRGNNFLPIKDHNLDTDEVMSDNLCIMECNAAKQSLDTASPLWLLAARVVIREKLPFSYTNLPYNLVDLLLELPKCACGKLCYGSNIYERAINANFITIEKLVYMPVFDTVKYYPFCRSYQIYEDIVLCGKKCLGIKRVIH